jgi:serine/threonine protein kinase
LDAQAAEAAADLQREAEVMAQVSNHSHVVAFRGILIQPTLAVVTEFMPLGSVEELLVRPGARYVRPRLSLHRVVRMAAEAAAGVLHLHAAGVIHRDLAARNFLVAADYLTKVSDFGLCRVKDAQAMLAGRAGGGGGAALTTQTSVGPVRWMSPESIMDRAYSEPSDVFSFGVALYEMLVGAQPWAGRDPLQAALAVVHGERMALPSGTDPHLAALMVACWAAAPEARPDMGSVHEQLLAWLAGHGTDTPLPSPPAQSQYTTQQPQQHEAGDGYLGPVRGAQRATSEAAARVGRPFPPGPQAASLVGTLAGAAAPEAVADDTAAGDAWLLDALTGATGRSSDFDPQRH